MSAGPALLKCCNASLELLQQACFEIVSRLVTMVLRFPFHKRV